MLILDRAETEALLDPDALVDVLARAMVDLSAGRCSVPTRIAAMVSERDGLLGAMPAYVPSLDALTTKLVTVFPHNTTAPSHQAVVLVFDATDGTPVALLDGTSITAARTAAGSALATAHLARADAGVLAVIGTGVQARAHLRAVPRVRSLREIRIAGRDPDRVGALAAETRAATGVPVMAAASFEAACDGADIVCATTHADAPVVRRAWLAPGTHVNSVGFNPAGAEVDAATVADALLVVESREAALAPYPGGAADLLEPIAAGVIGPDHVHAEIGEIIAGERAGRTDPAQITLYKSVGVGAQDAAAASLVLARARAAGTGSEIDL